MTGDPIVMVVDDDPSVRSSLKLLVSTVGLRVESFESAETVLERTLPDTVSCFVIGCSAAWIERTGFSARACGEKH
jgi:FixJ family two-component response regulator